MDIGQERQLAATNGRHASSYSRPYLLYPFKKCYISIKKLGRAFYAPPWWSKILLNFVILCVVEVNGHQHIWKNTTQM